jgi:hypothetical protein
MYLAVGSVVAFEPDRIRVPALPIVKSNTSIHPAMTQPETHRFENRCHRHQRRHGWSFDTEGMYHARISEGGKPEIGMYKDDK